MNKDQIEYNMALVAGLELIWGRGFLSPGGPEEVAETLAGRDITGTEVLDIGCGIGGVDLLLAEWFGAARVVGIDVEEPNLQLATQRAAEKDLADRVSYRLVEAKPGPLPFPAGSFDVVFSKDAIIHIPDKQALFTDIYRMLRPGGRFIASDWLRVDDHPPSAAMERYIASEGLSFSMASPERYRRAMTLAGFRDIEIRDRNAWYVERARNELSAISGPLRASLVEIVGEHEADREAYVWSCMIPVLESGELRPTHLYGKKGL